MFYFKKSTAESLWFFKNKFQLKKAFAGPLPGPCELQELVYIVCISGEGGLLQ